MAVNRKLYLALRWLLNACYVNAWRVTSYGQESFATAASSTLWTDTNFFIPATPIPSAVKTVTEIQGSREDITMEVILLPPDSEITTVPPPPSDPLQTFYYVPVTFTPPPSPRCNTTWSHVSTVDINVPLEVQSLLTPWSVSTSSSTGSIRDGKTLKPVPYTAVYAILYPTDVADDVYASASLAQLPYIITSCAPHFFDLSTTVVYPSGPTRTISTTGTAILPTNGVSQYGIKCGAENPYCINCDKNRAYCEHKCPKWRGHTSYPVTGEYLHCEDADYWIWGSYTYHSKDLERAKIAVPVSWCGFFFLLGLIENWLNFVSLMRGEEARLGVPRFWTPATLGLSMLFLGPAWKARSGHDQAVLRMQWRERNVWRKAGVYLMYAWRWTYPHVLGDEPFVLESKSGVIARRFVGDRGKY